MKLNSRVQSFAKETTSTLKLEIDVRNNGKKMRKNNKNKENK